MAAPLTGFILDPTDADIVKVLEETSAGRKPEWLREVNVYTDHPTKVFGASKPAVEVKQKHIVLGRIMYGDILDRPLPVPGCVYRQAGNPVPVFDEVTGCQIGTYKFFKLWEHDHSSPWSLKEFKSLSPDLADYCFAVYVVCFRSDRYVQAENQMSKAAKTMIKAATPVKQTISPLSPVTPASSQPVRSSRGLVYELSSSEAIESCVRTRSVAQEQIKTDLMVADEFVQFAEIREEPHPLSYVLPLSQAKEVVGENETFVVEKSPGVISCNTSDLVEEEMVLPLAQSIKGKEVLVDDDQIVEEMVLPLAQSIKGNGFASCSSEPSAIVLYQKKPLAPPVKVDDSLKKQLVLYQKKVDPVDDQIVKADDAADSLKKQHSATPSALFICAFMAFALGFLISFILFAM